MHYNPHPAHSLYGRIKAVKPIVVAVAVVVVPVAVVVVVVIVIFAL